MTAGGLAFARAASHIGPKHFFRDPDGARRKSAVNHIRSYSIASSG
jgi:hypothetical protein